MLRTEVLSTGFYGSERMITNDDLTQWIEASDEWIRQRWGTVERRWVGNGCASERKVEPICAA